jgi:hypothetical protein
MEDNMPKTGWANKRRTKSYGWATTKATANQWALIDIAIKEFIRKYPLHWIAFQKDLRSKRSKYNVAKEGGLKKSNFRNTASFPVIYDNGGEQVDSLLPVLKKIIPELTHKHSVNYATFLRKYPVFLPGEKF